MSSYLERTALHLAAAQGHIEVCRFLLEHKANPSIRYKQGDHLLISRDCQSDPKHIRKWRPLDYAVWNGYPDVVALILSYSAKEEVNMNDWRWTPLMYAAYLGHTKVAKVLLDFAQERSYPIQGFQLTTFYVNRFSAMLMKKDLQEYKTVLDHAQKAEMAELLLKYGSRLEFCTVQKQKEWKPVQEKILAEKSK